MCMRYCSALLLEATCNLLYFSKLDCVCIRVCLCIILVHFCFSIVTRGITCNGIYCQAFKSSPSTLSTHNTLFIIICYYFQKFLVASSSTLLLYLLHLITTTSTMQVHTCTLSLPPSGSFFLSFSLYTYYTVVFQYFRMLFCCYIVLCYPFDWSFCYCIIHIQLDYFLIDCSVSPPPDHYHLYQILSV